MLTTVHRESNLLTAHMVRGRLVSEGMAATLYGEYLIAIDWRTALAYGEIQMQVPAAQTEPASAVLAEWRHGVFERDLEAQLGLPADVCARCGARDWQPQRLSGAAHWLILWALLALSLLPAPAPVTGRRCRACGHIERGDVRSGENSA